MTLRVTRQFGEVLGTGAGTVRVARQYMEVLSGGATIHNESVTSDINFADESLYYLGAGESMMAESVMNITQTLVTSGLLQDVSTVMSMQQTLVGQSPIYQFMTSPMHIQSILATPGQIRNLALESEMTIIGLVGRGYDISVSSPLGLLQDMFRHHTPESTMNLVQTVDYGKSRGMEVSVLDLSQTVVLNGDWTRPVTQTLGIGHSLTYYVPNPCSKKSYSPFIGESTLSGAPIAPDASLPFAPGLPAGERFQLLYPGLGEATDTVELRAPNLDNRERLAFTRINRETRGGRLIVFADPTWPQVNTLVLSFSGLNKAEIDTLQTFLVAHLGEETGLIDWEGHHWVGVITSPTERAVQDGKGCDGNWTIGLEFEGVMLEEAPSGSHMALVSSVVAELV